MGGIACSGETVNALPRIALERASLHLAGRRILDAVSWSLRAGEHWAFVGANGAGKSSLLRVIAGLQWIDPDGGRRTYSADGAKLDAVGRAKRWIGYVSAEQHERYARLQLTYSGRTLVASGFDDCVYLHRAPRPFEERRIDALSARFELDSFIRRPVCELSSGQLRRLLIARALAHEPHVLILDEFSSGLDAPARAGILAFLDAVAAGVTLVVASHREADFPPALTHIARIDDGRIVESAVRTGARAPGGPEPTRARRGQGGRPAAAARPREPVGAEDRRAVLIDIRGADVYRGETLVLRNVAWQLRRGEHTAIRGANGAGKTTFAGLIAGTIAAASGAQIVRFGATAPFDVWKLKERIAHVSDDLQVAYAASDTVEDVIASGFPASIGLFTAPTPQQRRTVADIVARVGLEGLSGRSFAQLSFGERRQVLIARSFVRRPEVYILDEIWNGLDARFRRALHEFLTEMIAAGTTLVVVAHEDDEDVAVLAHRVCHIEKGRIVQALIPRRRARLEESP